MKAAALWAMALLFASSSWSKESVKPLQSKVQSVTVYTQGALVTEKGSEMVEAGKTSLVFLNIPEGIDPAHMHVSINKELRILAVAHMLPETFASLDDELLKPLNDSMSSIKVLQESVGYKRNSLLEEKNMVLANKSIGGLNTGVNIAELKKAADFFRSRLSGIDQKLLALNQQERILNSRMSRLQEKIDEASRSFTSTSHKVMVTVQSASKTKAEVELSYLVKGAGWAPAYEIHYKDISSPILFQYKGRVFNATGIPWEGVKLALSTADPNQTAEKPDLSPWTLDYKTDQPLSYSGRNPGKYGIDNNMEGYLNGQYTKTDKGTGGTTKTSREQVKFSEVVTNELSVNFEIKEPGIIPSDSKPYTVDVQSYTLPAVYKYICIPKVDHDAFLLSRITGWEELNLIEGPVDIYNNDTYTGQSYLNTRFSNDTLDISLGRDKKVTITRIKREDFTQKQLIGLNRTENYLYEIAVRNNNSKPIDIDLFDQVPVSQQSDIDVTVKEISGAELEKLSGKLTWRMNILPADTKKVTNSFTVKYPKYRQVEVRKWRKINCPDF